MVPFTAISSCVSLLLTQLRLSSNAASRYASVAVPVLRAFGSSPDGPPKKPLNAYVRYLQQQRHIIVRQCPGLSVPQVTQKAAQQWKDLTAEQKKPYVEAAAADTQQYHADMERYKAELMPEQSDDLKKKKREIKAKREAIRKKKELINLGKPKRPRTAINIFMTEHFEEAKGETALAKMKALVDVWKNLYSGQKQVYLQLAEDDRIRYKDEMKIWEEQMIKIGREDLIRKKSAGAKRSSEQNKGTESNLLKKG